MKVLFDVNVLLDVFLDRAPWDVDSKAAFKLALDGRVDGYISAITPTTLFYVARSLVGTDQAFLIVAKCLAVLSVATVDGQVLVDALKVTGKDFEDHVQFTSAEAAKLDAVVTRDAAGFTASVLQILTPAELVRTQP
jgi:predicted nucleic acid-binding protein